MVEITNKTKNPVLGRTEIEFQLTSKVTPSRAELKADLAKALKSKEGLIIIDLVDQKSGSNLTTGKAKVYDNEDIIKKVELEYRSKRGVKEKKEEEAAPAPAAAEAAPEVKEEAPAEVKEEVQEPKEEAPSEAPAEKSE